MLKVRYSDGVGIAVSLLLYLNIYILRPNFAKQYWYILFSIVLLQFFVWKYLSTVFFVKMMNSFHITPPLFHLIWNSIVSNLPQIGLRFTWDRPIPFCKVRKWWQDTEIYPTIIMKQVGSWFLLKFCSVWFDEDTKAWSASLSGVGWNTCWRWRLLPLAGARHGVGLVWARQDMEMWAKYFQGRKLISWFPHYFSTH